MKLALTGSHGLIARHLVPALEQRAHQVVRVVRGRPGPGEVHWDPATAELDRGAIEVDAVVHLAGVGIASRRWNDAHKRAVLDSRRHGTHLLAERLAEAATKPAVLVSASAIGYYGDRGEEELTEPSAPGDDYLAGVCRQWEESTAPARQAGIRTVLLRSGIVQASDGGALKPQLPLFKAGMGARLGSGRQWTSWISIEDEVGAILHALDDERVSGPVNLAAPEAVRNATYTQVLGRVLHRPAVLAVPAPALRIALGREMADEILLVSQKVIPGVLDATGYDWRQPALEPALRALLDR
ncbi:MAG TPA: TIGR01777 family oxidoreductase [Acidimicrobiales bacterium]|jgi:hypothetical protein|nr:TIGR01777 family oxidoreductase [Acidimicrobiales bacterium]